MSSAEDAAGRIERLRDERKALPLLSVRRWKLGRELRRAILQVPASGGRR